MLLFFDLSKEILRHRNNATQVLQTEPIGPCSVSMIACSNNISPMPANRSSPLAAPLSIARPLGPVAPHTSPLSQQHRVDLQKKTCQTLPIEDL